MAAAVQGPGPPRIAGDTFDGKPDALPTVPLGTRVHDGSRPRGITRGGNDAE